MNRRLFFRFLAAAPLAIAAGPVLAAPPAKRGMTVAELRKTCEMRWGDECQPEAYVPLKDTRLSAGIIDGRSSAERFKLMVDEYRIKYGETDSLAARLFAGPNGWRP